MRKAARKAAVVFGATGALALSSLLAAQPAGAINRSDPCKPLDLILASNQSTCWANPGGTSVSLSGVKAWGAGQWAGCFNHQAGTQGFLQRSTGSFGGNNQVHVSFVFIATTNSNSTKPCRV